MKRREILASVGPIPTINVHRYRYQIIWREIFALVGIILRVDVHHTDANSVAAKVWHQYDLYH